ncbi:MAG: AAA family ATPase, partial [Clostridiales bacterium]|nr:AAA family ATPase [Clostridiales bacterium]
KIYSGTDPTFIEGDIFKTIIPLVDQASDQASDQAGDQANNQKDNTEEILEFCKIPRNRSEIQIFVGIKSRSYFSRKVLHPLIKGGLLKLTIPDKPTSPNQKYYYDRR